MDTYIVVISEIVGNEIHERMTRTVSLPNQGTLPAARAWLASIWNTELKHEHPNKSQSDFRVDYIRLSQLTW